MSGSDWLAIDNVQNIRVYMVYLSTMEQETSFGLEEMPIEKFADYAEEQGEVFSLENFIKSFNYNEGLSCDGFIRMAVVKDGTIIKEIEEV